MEKASGGQAFSTDTDQVVLFSVTFQPNDKTQVLGQLHLLREEWEDRHESGSKVSMEGDDHVGFKHVDEAHLPISANKLAG